MIFHISFHLSDGTMSKSDSRRQMRLPLPESHGWALALRARSQGIHHRRVGDPEVIAKWLEDWTDLLTFEVTPVMNDEQLARVIA